MDESLPSAEKDALACCEHCEGAPTSRCWVADSIDGHAEPCPKCFPQTPGGSDA